MVCRNLRVRVLRRRAIFQVLPNVGRAAIVATFRFDPRLNFYRVVWSGKSRVLEIRSIRHRKETPCIRSDYVRICFVNVAKIARNIKVIAFDRLALPASLTLGWLVCRRR